MELIDELESRLFGMAKVGCSFFDITCKFHNKLDLEPAFIRCEGMLQSQRIRFNVIVANLFRKSLK